MSAIHAPMFSGGDPHFANVLLLMHLETTGFIDEAGHTVVNTGAGSITADQVKFGSKSYVPTSEISTYYPQLESTSSDFAIGTSDLTIEAFVYITNYAGDKRLFVFDGVNFFSEIQANTGKLSGYSSGTIGGVGNPVPLNQWVHVAFVRSGGVVSGYINGVSQWSAAHTYNYTATAVDAVYGVGGSYWYIDELRVTKYARYTANFTPPTAPFPNS